MNDECITTLPIFQRQEWGIAEIKDESVIYKSKNQLKYVYNSQVELRRDSFFNYLQTALSTFHELLARPEDGTAQLNTKVEIYSEALQMLLQMSVYSKFIKI